MLQQNAMKERRRENACLLHKLNSLMPSGVSLSPTKAPPLDENKVSKSDARRLHFTVRNFIANIKDLHHNYILPLVQIILSFSTHLCFRRCTCSNKCKLRRNPISYSFAI